MLNFAYKKLACSPPNLKDNAPQANGRVLSINRQKLVELKVVFQSGKYAEGDSVYVRADHLAHTWAKELYQMGDKEIVLVPEETVVADDRADAPVQVPWLTYGSSPATSTGGPEK